MVGVVVVHYESPAALDLVLTALERSGRALRVVVADDGSRVLPEPGDRPFPVEVVTQPDLGFRAAAARNLGARTLLRSAPDLDALFFLDGDTIPAPGYLAAMCDALATAAGSPGRRMLVVGRRRYADLDGLTREAVMEFVAAPDEAPDRILADTAWLDEGYAATDLLRAADDRSYRFVISAVLGLTRELWDALGGFDESFVGYGGEDWDLGNRAWLAGADLRHAPAAVAWHDGPDAAGRSEGTDARARIAAKNAEIRRLADVVTEPGARDPGLLWECPDVVVEVDDRGWEPADALLTCADLVRGSDARVWLTDGRVLREGLWPATDPRVALGPVPARQRDRARHRVHVTRPLRSTAPVSEICRQGPVAVPGLTVERTRDLNRARSLTGDPVHAPQHPPSATRTQDRALRLPRPDGNLEAEWGWREAETLPPLVDTPDPSICAGVPAPDLGDPR